MSRQYNGWRTTANEQATRQYNYGWRVTTNEQIPAATQNLPIKPLIVLQAINRAATY